MLRLLFSALGVRFCMISGVKRIPTRFKTTLMSIIAWCTANKYF